MARDLGTALTAEVQKRRHNPIMLVEIGTADPAHPVRAWSGRGDFIWSGKTFKGTGIYGKVSLVEESKDLKANGLTFELSGVPAELLEVSLEQMRQGRDAYVWFACVDSAVKLVGDVYLLSRTLTDVPEIEDNGNTVTIRISAEHKLIDLQRPRVRRFTPADQHLTDPEDRGFDFVAELQDKQITWGRT